MTQLIKIILLFSLLFSLTVKAQVSHLSINERNFEIGHYPKIRLNIVADRSDLSRLQFSVKQAQSEEKLMVQGLNTFMLLLTGVEDVTDPDARLVIREYRTDHWLELKSIALFKTPAKIATKSLGSEVVGEQSYASELVQTQVGSEVPATKSNQPALTSEVPATGIDSQLMAQPVASAPLISSSQAQSESAAADTREAVTEVDRTQGAIEPTITDVQSPPKPLLQKDCFLDYAAGETLWSIGNRFAQQWQVGAYSAMVAIFEANPSAFTKHKITGLMKQAKLACPTPDLIKRQGGNEEARQKYLNLQ